ncbi:hypothetical protein GP486_002985 [Trichoglossum hirsutum]|uniref:3,2-trans-enoyl-CoA isomerase n=1 Tax=Trichoglossum hirsutum TaxID=265104 RepID=A0A9P8LDY3_9PEZI|nr:hypothetical protein GP486_002985 [Trichoglossum hirsutum]
MAETQNEPITLEVHGKIAIITLNIERKLNALTPVHYHLLGKLLRDVATRDEVVVTLLTGNGRYFSAGIDVTSHRANPPGQDARQFWLKSFLATNIEVTRAFYTHPKILVTALNGPVLGLTAALIAHSDFIYATENAFLMTPFTSIGLVTEGASSVAFVRRMGIARANEALILSKRISARELLESGFVNKIIPESNFREGVLAYVKEHFGDHLNGESMLKAKALIRGPEMGLMEQQNAMEVFGGVERFMLGIPQEEFRKLASGAKRHKL